MLCTFFIPHLSYGTYLTENDRKQKNIYRSLRTARFAYVALCYGSSRFLTSTVIGIDMLRMKPANQFKEWPRAQHSRCGCSCDF